LIGPALPESINARATVLGVSADALRWRLAFTGLLAQKTANEIPSTALRHNGSNRPARQEFPPLYSRAFMAVVVDAIEEGCISVRRTAKLLDTTIEGLAELISAHGLVVPDTVH
jgi:XRE family transcriptional regulator, fatty acid utilization regulator